MRHKGLWSVNGKKIGCAALLRTSIANAKVTFTLAALKGRLQRLTTAGAAAAAAPRVCARAPPMAMPGERVGRSLWEPRAQTLTAREAQLS